MPQSGLSADLDSFDLLDLVQVIQMTRRNLSLVVRSGAQNLGMLRFAQGELLWAEFGALRGEEAFMALAAQHTGSIEELASDGSGERNVNQPLARLVMQAVEYRDAYARRPPPSQESARFSRPIQPSNPAPLPLQAPAHLNGSASRPLLGNAPPESEEMLPDEDLAPAWVREIHLASEGFSAQPTSAIVSVPAAVPQQTPPQPPRSVYAAQTEPLTPPPLPAASSLQEKMDVQIPEPRVPLANLNGKFTLPSLSNGNRASSQPSSEPQDDPPTVPLPTVQGGLRDYAARREPSPPQQESGPGVKPEIDPLPGQALMVRSAPAAAAPLHAPLAEPEPLPASAPSVPAAPPGEPKMSSLSILEQLAYGGSGNTSSADSALFETGAPATLERLAKPGVGSIPTSGGAGAAATFVASGPEDGAASASAAPGSAMAALNNLAALSPAPSGAEGMPPLQQALETFAEQVGATCIATAVIRTDGMLVAEHKVRRGQDQDLGSPAYHMAQVMQSSLRALLMGGWGDLEDTIITGSTHSVMLRRLGRAEKGLFHVAVLERSGNPGLCRVRMRGIETALLQALSVNIPSATS